MLPYHRGACGIFGKIVYIVKMINNTNQQDVIDRAIFIYVG